MVFRSRYNLSARREVSIACCLTPHFWKISLESIAQRQSMLDQPKRPEQRPHLSPELTHRPRPQTLPVCTENLFRVDEVKESPELTEWSDYYVWYWGFWPRHSSRRADLKLRTRCFDISWQRGAFCAVRSWVNCITNMLGLDWR